VDWVNLFIDYYDMKIKLITIQIPTGSGKTVNKIIILDGKRSIIQIRNKYTICLARSLVVGLAVHNRETFTRYIGNNHTEDELKQINKTKQKRNKVILSDNEKKYLINGKKLQDILAKALHRLRKTLITDFDDVKHFESRQIYKGKENPIKVYILMFESLLYSKISNTANDDHHK